jgi:hypothetical protein
MQICDNGVIRDMTETEEYTANNLPDPAEQVSDTELLNILMGGAE